MPIQALNHTHTHTHTHTHREREREREILGNINITQHMFTTSPEKNGEAAAAEIALPKVPTNLI